MSSNEAARIAFKVFGVTRSTHKYIFSGGTQRTENFPMLKKTFNLYKAGSTLTHIALPTSQWNRSNFHNCTISRFQKRRTIIILIQTLPHAHCSGQENS